MPVSAVIDKGSLQRGLNPRHLCQIYVSCELPLVQRLKVEFLNLVAVCHHNAGFFRVGGIDEHCLCHVILARNCPARLHRAMP